MRDHWEQVEEHTWALPGDGGPTERALLPYQRPAILRKVGSFAVPNPEVHFREGRKSTRKKTYR